MMAGQVVGGGHFRRSRPCVRHTRDAPASGAAGSGVAGRRPGPDNSRLWVTNRHDLHIRNVSRRTMTDSDNGEVVGGRVHLHVTPHGEDITIGGHLHRAMVRDFVARAYKTEAGTP